MSENLRQNKNDGAVVAMFSFTWDEAELQYTTNGHGIKSHQKVEIECHRSILKNTKTMNTWILKENDWVLKEKETVSKVHHHQNSVHVSKYQTYGKHFWLNW